MFVTRAPNHYIYSMKKTFTLLLILISFSCFSQIPDGYYSAAEGLQGDELKAALNGIIKGHTEYPYTSSSTDTWDILKESDRDPENPDNVILIYTGWSVDAEQEYNSGSGWSREHVWAKSHGDFGTSEGAGTDAHHLRPCDISVNSARGNKDFDNGGSPHSEATECNTDTDSWEPRDEEKGDVARMMFYMATRYEGNSGEPDLELVDYTGTDGPIFGKLTTLLQWHKDDPVDDFENNRNEVVYSYQGNRNPFIDHPEYVEAVFNPSTSTSTLIKESEIKIYPNPATDILKIEAPENHKTEFYSIIGEQVLVSTKETIDISRFDSGIYFVVVKNELGTTIKSFKLIKK